MSLPHHTISSQFITVLTSHPQHEVLAAVARGTHVLLCGHSNTERGYLPTLRTKLLEELKTDSDFADAASLEVEVSQTDADPLEIV